MKQLVLPKKRQKIGEVLRQWMVIIGSLYLFLNALTSFAAKPSLPLLTLPEAEKLAIRHEPTLQSLQANSDALHQQAIADEQLPDPKLMVGAANVPTNNFSFTQDDMTMMDVGIEQSFPAGHSRAAKSRQTQAMVQAEQNRQVAQQRLIIRKVDEAWLELYYWQQSAKIVKANQSLLKQSVKAAASNYAAGKSTQQTLLQTQLEYSNLQDEQLQIQQRIAEWQAELGRWIDPIQAQRPLAKPISVWSVPRFALLQQHLVNHPLLQVNAASIQAAREGVAWAKEQYKPGFDVDVGYGIRQGSSADGMRRANFVGAQVKLDLPVFTRQRQDRRLQASEDQLTSAELTRQAQYRDLVRDLMSEYATWQTLTLREQQYQRHLLPEAKQNAKAALRAYQSATADLTTVLRANSLALTTQLQYLRIQVDRAKAQAALRYLGGE